MIPGFYMFTINGHQIIDILIQNEWIYQNRNISTTNVDLLKSIFGRLPEPDNPIWVDIMDLQDLIYLVLDDKQFNR